MGAPYIYGISRLRVKDLHSATYIYVVRRLRVNVVHTRTIPTPVCYMWQIRRMQMQSRWKNTMNSFLYTAKAGKFESSNSSWIYGWTAFQIKMSLLWVAKWHTNQN